MQFVQRLLALKVRMDQVIEQSFQQHKQFVQTLTNAFETFLNQNPRSAEYLSLYIDEILRKGARTGLPGDSISNRPELIGTSTDARLGGSYIPVSAGIGGDEVEGELDRVMMLFRYLQDKDVFE